MCLSKLPALTAAALIILLLTSCGQPEAAVSQPSSHTSNVNPLTPPNSETNPLDGLWLTTGYGQLYEIEGEQFQIYAVTEISCVPMLSGKMLPAQTRYSPHSDIEAWLDIQLLLEDGIQKIGVQVLPGTTENEKQFLVDGLTSYHTLTQLEQWPEPCSSPLKDSPLTTFEVFGETYAEHYPFFAMKGIDWTAVRDHYRPQITEQTSDEELFTIMQEMIEPLEDAHTWIQPIDLDASFEGQRPDSNPLSEADWARTAEIVENEYLVTPLTHYANNEIAFGLLPGEIGYLRINGFSDYAPKNDYWLGLDALETALDEIFSQPLSGLIIDIRANDGGSDQYGLQVANRLSQQVYHAYTIQARHDRNDPTQWTDGQSIYVSPTDRPSYHGPVVLLTSRYTVSAAETFTMALMERTAPVTHIGENTQGVFSVVLVHILPNGWWIGLQNEQFLTSDGRTFDGPGIPPGIQLPVFTQDELASGQDNALEAALSHLSLTSSSLIQN